MAIIGIYKITNPKGKVYIGRSFDIENRLKYYKNLQSKKQKLIHYSLLKYGYENHKIEIIAKGNYNKPLLDELEKHFIRLYNTYKFGLNLTGGGDGFGPGELNYMYGKKHKKETGIKIGIANSKRVITEQTREKLSTSRSGEKNYKSKKVINTTTNEIYPCVRVAAEKNNINYSALRSCLNGACKNKTNLKFF
jgi:hypothetical protein